MRNPLSLVADRLNDHEADKDAWRYWYLNGFDMPMVTAALGATWLDWGLGPRAMVDSWRDHECKHVMTGNGHAQCENFMHYRASLVIDLGPFYAEFAVEWREDITPEPEVGYDAAERANGSAAHRDVPAAT